MSTALAIFDLPRFRRPKEWGGSEASPSFKISMIYSDELGPDLVAFQDSPTHVTIGPARTMSLAEYRQALAATQSKWEMVTKP